MKVFSTTRTKRSTAFVALLVWLFALDTSKESSAKCCDDGTIALPNGHSGVDQIDPGSAPLVATLWTPSAHVASVPRRLDDLQLHTVGPRLRVRYSRLAL